MMQILKSLMISPDSGIYIRPNRRLKCFLIDENTDERQICVTCGDFLQIEIVLEWPVGAAIFSSGMMVCVS